MKDYASELFKKVREKEEKARREKLRSLFPESFWKKMADDFEKAFIYGIKEK